MSCLQKKSIPLDAFGTRGSGKAPYAGLPAAGRVCAPPPASGQPRSARPSRRHAHGLHRKNAPNTARRDATLHGIVLRGAPTLLSGMLAQVPVGTRVKRHAPLRLSGGARQRASSRLRSVAAHISRYRGTLLHLGGSAPPIPLGGLRPPLLALRAITSLLWRLCLQTSAALRRRASGWRFSKASILHAPPPWDGPIRRLGVRLPYPSQWNAIQSVSVPGGNSKASPGSRLNPTPRRARALRSIHIAHALSPPKL